MKKSTALLIILGFLAVFLFQCVSPPEVEQPTRTPRPTKEPTPENHVQLTRDAYTASLRGTIKEATPVNTPAFRMEWENNRDQQINLRQHLPAGTVLRIEAPRFNDFGLFSVWALDDDMVKSQLLMNTTTSREIENFRLREDTKYLKVDTDGSNPWTITVISTP